MPDQPDNLEEMRQMMFTSGTGTGGFYKTQRDADQYQSFCQLFDGIVFTGGNPRSKITDVIRCPKDKIVDFRTEIFIADQMTQFPVIQRAVFPDDITPIPPNIRVFSNESALHIS